MLETLNSFSAIIVTISSVIIALTTILVFFGKFRKWLINKIAADVDFSKIDKRCKIYKDHETVSKIETLIDDGVFEVLQKNQESIEASLNELKMSTLRIEIGRLLDHEPQNKDLIYKLFDYYSSKGGNSYMCAEIKKWEKKYVFSSDKP